MFNNNDNTGAPLPNLGIPDDIFALVEPLVRPDWISQVQIEGQLVQLYRDYREGRQRSFLTNKQRESLNIKTLASEQLYMNYCDLVVQTMADRLTVASIDGDSPAASAWSAALLAYNRFDGLQMDVTDNSLGDGVTYLMEDFDNDTQMVGMHHEPAWDGYLGVIAVYDRMLKNIVVAIKVWFENSTFRRFNVYFPDHIEKYIEAEGDAKGGGRKIVAYADEKTGELLGGVDEAGNRRGVEWKDKNGNPLGVPLVPVPNRAKSHRTQGISVLAPVIPLQDALNRTLIDMLMTSGLTAFQIKFALGFKPPATIAPGDTVFVEGPVGKDQQVDFKALAQGELVPFISQAEFLIDQIGTISQTPLPDVMGADSSSGEALKQREIGLLSKVERYKVKAGNDWEDVLAMAVRIQAAFGTQQPPVVKRWTTKWKDSQLRNDAQTIANALLIEPLVGAEEAIRQIAPVYGWDEIKIKALVTAKQAQNAAAMQALMKSVPSFGAFQPPTGATSGTGAADQEAAAA